MLTSLETKHNHDRCMARPTKRLQHILLLAQQLVATRAHKTKR